MVVSKVIKKIPSMRDAVRKTMAVPLGYSIPLSGVLVGLSSAA